MNACYLIKFHYDRDGMRTPGLTLAEGGQAAEELVHGEFCANWGESTQTVEKAKRYYSPELNEFIVIDDFIWLPATDAVILKRYLC